MVQLSWTSHPLRDEPGHRSGTLIIVILGTSALIGYSFNGWGYTALSVAMLAAAMSRYLLPTHYTLDETGVNIAHLGMHRNHPWAQFRRIVRHPDGIFLSPFNHPHRLDSFRGQFLRADHRVDEVLYVVRKHITDDAV